MRRLPALLRLLAALAAVLLLALASGCGGGDSKQGKALLRRGFDESIGSARVTIDLTAQLDGIPKLQQPLRVQLSGPYRTNGGAKIPSVNWQANVAFGGQAFTAGLISTGDRAFLLFGGTPYQFAPATVAKLNRSWSARPAGGGGGVAGLGIDPVRWVTNVSDEGDSDVAGVRTTHVSAQVDIGKLLPDLGKLTARAAAGGVPTPAFGPREIAQVEKVVKNPTLDVYVGKRDGKIRRLSTDITFSVPQRSRARFGGLKGGTISLTVELAEVGVPQRILAPVRGRPMAELRKQIGPLNGLGGLLGGAAGRAPSTRYSQCLAKANPSDTAALQRCTRFLR